MKRRTITQVVPALIMTGAAAVPLVTTYEILTHVPGVGGVALSPSGPVAAAPPASSSRTTGASAPSASGGTRTIQGPSESDPFGNVQATVTLSGQRITNVSISAPMDNPRSASINQQAVPYLVSETLQAQSAQVNLVSGATYTSQAYIQSLQGALSQAGVGNNATAGNPASSGSSSQTHAVAGGGDD